MQRTAGQFTTTTADGETRTVYELAESELVTDEIGREREKISGWHFALDDGTPVVCIHPGQYQTVEANPVTLTSDDPHAP